MARDGSRCRFILKLQSDFLNNKKNKTPDCRVD